MVLELAAQACTCRASLTSTCTPASRLLARTVVVVVVVVVVV
jgi:hypothetical protein